MISHQVDRYSIYYVPVTLEITVVTLCDKMEALYRPNQAVPNSVINTLSPVGALAAMTSLTIL